MEKQASPNPEESQRVVLVQEARSGRPSPIMILIVIQFFVMIGIGIWTVTTLMPEKDSLESKNQSESNAANPDPRDTQEKGKQEELDEPSPVATLAPATSVPMGVSGSKAQLQWHFDGHDYFALAGIVIVKGKDESIAEFIFPGSEAHKLTEGQELRLRNRTLKVEKILEREVLLSNQGSIYTCKLSDAGSHLVIAGASLNEGVDTPIPYGDTNPKGEDVGQPIDPRNLTDLPDETRRKIEKIAGEDTPSEEVGLPPIVWDTRQAQWEPKWLHIVKLFDERAHLEAAQNDAGRFIGARIIAFRPAPKGEIPKDGEEKQPEDPKAKKDLRFEALEGFGFSENDIITHINNQPVIGPGDFFKVLKATRFHDGVDFRMLRRDKEQFIYFQVERN